MPAVCDLSTGSTRHNPSCFGSFRSCQRGLHIGARRLKPGCFHSCQRSLNLLPAEAEAVQHTQQLPTVAGPHAQRRAQQPPSLRHRCKLLALHSPYKGFRYGLDRCTLAAESPRPPDPVSCPAAASVRQPQTAGLALAVATAAMKLAQRLPCPITNAPRVVICQLASPQLLPVITDIASDEGFRSEYVQTMSSSSGGAKARMSCLLLAYLRTTLHLPRPRQAPGMQVIARKLRSLCFTCARACQSSSATATQEQVKRAAPALHVGILLQPARQKQTAVSQDNVPDSIWRRVLYPHVALLVPPERPSLSAPSPCELWSMYTVGVLHALLLTGSQHTSSNSGTRMPATHNSKTSASHHSVCSCCAVHRDRTQALGQRQRSMQHTQPGKPTRCLHCITPCGDRSRCTVRRHKRMPAAGQSRVHRLAPLASSNIRVQQDHDITGGAAALIQEVPESARCQLGPRA